MAIVKSDQSLPKRPPIILIYAEPGTGKTSIGNTCEVPLNLDFDRGIGRSILRKDTLQIANWDDILNEEKNGTFDNYKTLVIDTAKAALDDYLMSWIVQQDAKYGTPKHKLQAYGLLGDNFKLFINNRRSKDAAIIIIAHAKKDEDSKKNVPDVTGQSYQLLLRIADQVGYIYIKNGKRMIQFEPTEETVGKNVAGLPVMEVPDKTSAEFKTFGKYLVDTVSDALASISEEQREAMAKSEQYQKDISECKTAEGLTKLVSDVNELPDYLKLPLRQLIKAKADECKYTWNIEGKHFVEPTQQGSENEQQEAKTKDWFITHIGQKVMAYKEGEEPSMIYVVDRKQAGELHKSQKENGYTFGEVKKLEEVVA